MRIATITFVTVSYFLIGCTPTTRSFVNLSHAGDSPAAVAFPTIHRDAITLENEDDVADDFGVASNDAKEMVRKQAYSHIARTLRTGTVVPLITPESPDLPSTPDSSRSFMVTMLESIDSDSCLHSFRIPKKKTVEQYFEGADAAIVICRMAIRKNVITIYNNPTLTFSDGKPSIGVAGTNVTSRTLEATVEYVLWDYRGNEMISFGESIVHVPVLVSTTQDNWHDLFEKIGRQILTHVPS